MMIVPIEGLLKVRDSANQLSIRLVLHIHGQAKDNQGRGVQFSSPQRKIPGQVVSKVIERFTDSWINPAVTGLPSKRHSVTG